MNSTVYDLALKPLELTGLKKLRAELLSHAQGKTLEIGIGSGLNLSYYPEDVQLTGIEPDPSMRKKSLKRSKNINVKVEDGDAMALAFPDCEFDTVVGTLVFCTIADPQKAIKEVYRVLRPGGTFLLLEHVRRNGALIGPLLDKLTPIWVHVADGCHLNRDPSHFITSAGFKTIEFKEFWKGLGKFWILKKP